MIIIGEKINGFIPKTLAAIEARDESYLRELARAQTEAGAAYIDVCAGTAPDKEPETLEWLIQLVQSTVETPLCIDSSNPQLILDLLPLCKKPGLINSVSKEAGKTETVFPAIAGTEWKIIALTGNAEGIPDNPEQKYAIAKEIIAEAAACGIDNERLFIDPCVSTLATKQDCLLSFAETTRRVRAEYPRVHVTSGLSNISFGMPHRAAINAQFLALAMAAGMDSAILDPTSATMQATMHAVNALLGHDEYCMDYISAYRSGLFGA